LKESRSSSPETGHCVIGLASSLAPIHLEGSVSLLGQIARRELFTKYQESDIFCLPTLREAGGGAILEAMACGLPIVTSDYGGPRCSVTDDCSIRIEMVDSREYVADLSPALERSARNEDLRRSMGQRARQRALGESHCRRWTGRFEISAESMLPDCFGWRTPRH